MPTTQRLRFNFLILALYKFTYLLTYLLVYCKFTGFFLSDKNLIDLPEQIAFYQKCTMFRNKQYGHVGLLMTPTTSIFKTVTCFWRNIT